MKFSKLPFFVAMLLCFALPLMATAHDTWVQTNTNLVRMGSTIYIDLMLGNHANHHRDYRLAGKINPEFVTLKAISPDGKSHDLKPGLSDFGSDAKTGYWIATFKPQAVGLYMIAQTSDQVVSYAPLRSIKSGKAFFIVTTDLNNPTIDRPGFDRLLGHPLELVPQNNAITGLTMGKPLKIKLLFQGKPLANTVVSFIPRGVTLKADFDENYERKTDEQGLVEFAIKDANYYLIVANHQDDNAKGENYNGTKYSATLTVQVTTACNCE